MNINRNNNKLKGKNIVFLGASITEGSKVDHHSFVEPLAETLGFDYLKASLAGSTMATVQETSYIYRLCEQLSKSYRGDLIVIQLSTNDIYKNIPMGKIEPGFDLNDFNTDTILGAVEFMIAYAKQTWSMNIAFYIVPNYENQQYASLIQSLYQLQSKWSFYILDPRKALSKEHIEPILYKSYMADSMHPNASGYELWWKPWFENQLLSLF